MRWVNVFLREAEKTLSEYDLTVDFSKGVNVNGSTDLFQSLGLLESLKHQSLTLLTRCRFLRELFLMCFADALKMPKLQK